ncbi:MAG: hypothetical protein AABZ23_00565 [Deltaproteobacteria bacterium]
MRKLTGKYLNELWKVGARHALYREDGKWYEHLKRFPGALFDYNGYVIFKTEKEYEQSSYLQHGIKLNVPHDGISAMPNYVHARK